MRSLCVLVLIFGGHRIASCDAVGAEPNKPARVLLLSGQNNHAWQLTTPKLRSLLEATGRFRVDVDERPDRLTGEQLAAYDAILSNWNSWGKGDGRIVDWPPSSKQAYIDFVRTGGGHVVVHAGSSSFPEWDEYLELTLATWKLGQTGHGPRHRFSVRIDAPDHPITRGLTSFQIHGELWHRAGVRPGVTVLASAFSAKERAGSGRDEPIAMVKEFGQGRSFTFLLGHAVDEMDNPGFAALLVRGTEWAATGNVTTGNNP